MASTYVPIATTTASGSVSTITFSSISSSYTDLILVVQGTTSTADEWGLRVNSDTGTNYSTTWLQGNGSIAQSSRYSNKTFGLIGYMRNTISSAIIQLQNYSNTTTYKTILSREADGTDGTWANVTLWRSTSAINSITLYALNNYNYSNSTTFTLYGIKAA